METIRAFRNQYSWLSNFYPCTVEWKGVTFPSVEHAFQAMKSLRREDWELISKLDTPAEAKRVGRTLQLRKDWNSLRRKAMAYCLLEKFTKNAALNALLLQTGNAFIQEGNTWNDTYWGVDLATGEGRNELGKLIMKVREHLQERGGCRNG